MKKKVLFVAALLAGMMACNKEVKEEGTTPSAPQANADGVITEVVGAVLGDKDNKASIETSTGAFSWALTDHVAFYDGSTFVKSDAASSASKSTTFTISYSGTRSAYAYYPYYLVQEVGTEVNGTGALAAIGSSTDKVVLPATYSLADVSGSTTPCPMVAENSGSSWTFHQLCGLLRLTVNLIPSGASYLKIDFNGQKVSGVFTVNAPKSETPGISTESNSTEDLITINGLSGQSSVTVNIPLPEGDGYGNITVVAYNGSNVPLMATHTSIKGDGTYYQATRAKAKPRMAALTQGVFSIAAGKYALIAPGNLMYQASTATWKFASPGWSRCSSTSGGNLTVDGRDQQEAWIDLFGWGTSGWHNASDPEWSHYQPWDASQETITGNNNKFGYGPNPTGSELSLVGVNANGDWGVYNRIGLDAPGTWRSLTQEEIAYLVNGRNASTVLGTENARFVKARIPGKVTGLMLFPDHYNHPEGAPSLTAINQASQPFTSNNFATEQVEYEAQWAALESAGVVFLPTAGLRGDIKDGKCTISNADYQGNYWTSTYRDGKNDCASILKFDKSGVNPNQYAGRERGMSVRLIKEL